MLLKSFVLTSDWYDKKDSMELCFWVHTDNGPLKLIFNQEKNVFFIPKDTNLNLPYNFTRKNVQLKSFDGQQVDAVYLDKYEHVKSAKDYCSNNSIRNYEIDIRPVERFLMERFINGTLEFEFNGESHLINPKVRNTSFNPKLSLLSLDIETGLDGSLYSIGLHFKGKNEQKKVIMLSDKVEIVEDVEFFKSELHVIQRFLKVLREWDPDLIIGWHVIGFDLMFLQDKCQKLGINFLIGRDDSSVILEQKGSGYYAKVPGRVVLDGPVLVRSSFYNFKNYKLETVAKEVLGTGKDIADSGVDKVEEIERRFKQDKLSLAKYNLLDCTLVIDIFEKLNLISLLVTRVQISGMLMDRVGISTAAFDHFMLPRIHRKGFVAPNAIDIERSEDNSGAMVYTPVCGIHEDVAVFDFKSLYPSIIRTFKIDPYSLLKKNNNTIATPNGISFSKTEHLIPNFIEDLMEKREVAKHQTNTALSQAIKILMNSFYGVMGSSKCRFYHSDLPMAITQTGQWILEKGKEFFENRSLRVLYGDTDSLFVKLNYDSDTNQLVNDFNHYLGKIIFDEFNLKSYLELEHEKTFDKLFFPESRHSQVGAKKRYVGVIKDQISFVGMEFVRSDWTELAKKFQYSLYQELFKERPLEQIIKQTISKLQNGEFDTDLVISKRLSKDPREYIKNIPTHVQAALKLNHTGPYRLKEVNYVMCINGPIPIELKPKDIDYQYYLEKQLKPVADDILKMFGDSFDSYLVGSQLSLF